MTKTWHSVYGQRRLDLFQRIMTMMPKKRDSSGIIGGLLRQRQLIDALRFPRLRKVARRRLCSERRGPPALRVRLCVRVTIAMRVLDF
jgi:hypothetical protein